MTAEPFLPPAHQRLVGRQVELALLDVAGVADGALVDEDRLDVLLVEDRRLAVELDDLDRLFFLLPLLLLRRADAQRR